MTIAAKTTVDVNSGSEDDEQKLHGGNDAILLPFSFRVTLTEFVEAKEAGMPDIFPCR